MPCLIARPNKQQGNNLCLMRLVERNIESHTNSVALIEPTTNITPLNDVLLASPLPFSYVVIEEKDEELPSDKSSDTRLIVFTDADFLTNVYINQYSNAQMGLNIVNWLAQLDYKTFVSAKEIKVERLDLTSKQKRQVIVILFLLPFFFVIAGLVLWLRNRVNL